MTHKLLDFIRRYGLISPGDMVTVAVSGGADSVALLFGLYLLREKLDLQLRAAHYNHQLRGAESDEDEDFVRRLCDQFDIPLTVGSSKVVTGKKGLEAAAREARYAFFATLPGKIATAHTADDNAETVLLHLIRGTGLKGLGAIAPQRGNVIRPMLAATRADVLAFLEEYHLSYRTDSSNHTDQFLRNRIRHNVMPLLRLENPRIDENLSAMALRLRDDEAALQTLAETEPQPQVGVLQAMHPAVRARALERFLKDNGVREPEAEHIQQVEALIWSDKPSAQACLPGGVTVMRCYDRLTVYRPLPPLTETTLPLPGEVTAGQYRIICQPAKEIVNTKDVFTLPEGNYVVRSRQEGDTIRLPGGSRTLKKLFIDRKIPAKLRDSIPVVADAQGVAAVYGVGADCCHSAKTLPAWQITVKLEKSASGTEYKENQADL